MCQLLEAKTNFYKERTIGVFKFPLQLTKAFPTQCAADTCTHTTNNLECLVHQLELLLHSHKSSDSLGVLLWLNRLRIRHCQCSSLNPCAVWAQARKFLHARVVAKKKKKKKKKALHTSGFIYFYTCTIFFLTLKANLLVPRTLAPISPKRKCAYTDTWTWIQTQTQSPPFSP